MIAPSQTILAAALLGALTGLLTYAQITFAPDVLRVSFFVMGISIVPGVLFGGLVAALCYYADRRSIMLPAAALLATTLAWVMATDAAAFVAIGLEQPESPVPFHLAAGGMVGGFVGGLVTAAGAAVGNARFRDRRKIALTVGVATLAGVLLVVGGNRMEGWLWILFVVWQAAVAASISYGLSRHP